MATWCWPCRSPRQPGFILVASPCVPPPVPGYLSYVSGVAGQDLHQQGSRRPGRMLAGGGMLVAIGVLLASGWWDGLLSHLRVRAGSVNLPL